MTTIDSLLLQFGDYAQYLRGYSPDTLRRFRVTLIIFQHLSGITAIEECTPARVREFFFRGRAERQWKSSTYIVYHRTLLVFFRWCCERGHLAENPTEGIELPRLEKTLPRGLSKRDGLRLLELLENYPYRLRFERFRNHALFAVMLYAGLRRKEVLELQVVDVDFEQGAILVRRGKGNKDRLVPMSATLRGILTRYVEARQALGRVCPRFFVAVQRDAGLTNEGMKCLVAFASRISGVQFSPHRLRHTFATLMLEGGCDIYALSKMMGHADIKTTTIYLSATAEHLRAQIAKHPLNFR